MITETNGSGPHQDPENGQGTNGHGNMHSNGHGTGTSELDVLSGSLRTALNRLRFQSTPFQTTTDAELAEKAVERALPVRLRGESFDQDLRRTYAFRGADIGANLYALHAERAVLIQFDLTPSISLRSEEPMISKNKHAHATKYLRSLRASFEGLVPTVRRFATGQPKEVQIEGPYIASCEAVLSLLVRVSRDTNYDDVYNRIKTFIELHPDNDDRKQFLPVARPRGEHYFPFDKPYRWTDDELIMAENYPPEELLDLVDRNGNPVTVEDLMNLYAHNHRNIPHSKGARGGERPDSAASEAASALSHWARRYR